MKRQVALKEVNRIYDVIDFIFDEYKELKKIKYDLWLMELELTDYQKGKYALLEHLVNNYLGETTEEKKED